MGEQILHLYLKKYKKIFLSFFISIFILITLLGEIHSVSSEKINYIKDPSNIYKVSAGTNLNSVITDLQQDWYKRILLKFYIKIYSISVIKSGDYDIQDLTYKSFINNLQQGNVIQRKFSIIEGMNKYDILKLIDNLNIDNNCINLECLNKDLNFIEGTLYPDTYFYTSSDSLANILQLSQAKMLNILEELWEQKTPSNPLKTKYEALILASIIEKEAGNNSEKNTIAGVFHNRLKQGMRLEADPTIIYGLLPNFDGDIKKKDILDSNNLYNTYRINGLPPTPIAIPSLSSLKSAILAPENNYLFFVASGNGDHYFSVTYNEHLEAVKRYQLKDK